MRDRELATRAGRCGAPPTPRVRAFWTALLTLPAIAAYLSPALTGWLQLDRERLLAGELWRLVSGHWTHWTTDHLLWDLVVFGLLLSLGLKRSPRRTLLLLLVAAPAISLAVLLLQPELGLYRGLSGLDAALFVLVGLLQLRRAVAYGDRRLTLLVGVLLLSFVAKVTFEYVTGGTLFVDSSGAGFVPVPLAHLVGGLCGIVLAWVRRIDAPAAASGWLNLPSGSRSVFAAGPAARPRARSQP